MKKVVSISLLILLTFALSVAQTEKKPLDHSVYDQWQSVEDARISTDGNWILYTVAPQEGDATLYVKHPDADKSYRLERGEEGQFDYNTTAAISLVKPFFADVRQAKIDEKKKKDMPKDSLAILYLDDGNIEKTARIQSFKVPEKAGGWVAWLHEKEKAEKDSTETEAEDALTDAEEDNGNGDKDKEGSLLVLKNLNTRTDTSFQFVSDYLFSENGKKLLFSTSGKDSVAVAGVYLFDTAASSLRALKQGKGSYKQLAIDEKGEQIAFVADLDTSKAKQRFFSAYYWNADHDSAMVIADTLTAGLPEDWMISEHGKVHFSGNGKRLFIGTAPIPVPEDTTIVEFEVAKVDIWNWKDPLLQPQQLKELKEEQKRSYTAVIDLKSKTFIQLADETMPTLRLADEGNADHAMGLSRLPYRQLISWEGATYRDIYYVSLKNGVRRLVQKKIRGANGISPKGHYLYWYDQIDSCWFAWSVKKAQTTNLTKSIDVSFANELNDVPDYPRSYGRLGWTQNDDKVLLYDRYDIWAVDPDNGESKNLTQGMGREENITFRYVRLDREERFLQPDQTLLLRSFDEDDKSAGFYQLTLNSDEKPQNLIQQDYRFSTPKKAEKAERLILTKESFVEPPNLWTSDLKFKEMQKLSDINPQQKEYLWGSAELVHWHSADGKALDGILYKPENFDPDKKYPMIVYFYERTSFTLNWYREPRPSPSTVRPSFYASRGYLFFIPDIVYEEGYPGKSALNCIVPGVLNLIEQGFVDEERIGIQGQSWGGYQVAYLVTRTNLFAAAMAGAPVSNMTSAYGGIRWGSGMSRMFQYEHTQSRIGGTLWEKPWHYLENSPLFRAPDITTPLLIMHNDGDGAVPWYQGIELFVAMRRLHKPAWMLNYNSEEHNLRKRQNRKDLSKRMQQFFDHYLKDAPAPVWMEKGVPAILKGKTWGFELIKEQ